MPVAGEFANESIPHANSSVLSFANFTLFAVNNRSRNVKNGLFRNSASQSGFEEFFGFIHHLPELPNTLSGKIITGFTVYDAVMIFIILLVVAFLKDKKIREERKPIFIPTRPPRGFRKYAILLETGQSPAGGTTSSVFIRLCGKLTKSPAFSLTWPNDIRSRQLFWSQNKDMFIISVPHYLGYIDAIEVMTDRCGDCPPWFLRSIRIMCLDNRKCWKSKINAWLRGDRKPFSFKSHLIGALSTREYMKKVFLQNHSWTMMWYRTLGSTFTCCHRSVILWFSFALALFGAHYLLYTWPYDPKARIDQETGLKIPIQYIVRGDNAISSGVLAAGVGAVIGTLLRALVRKCSGSIKWARIDDKDDFGHVMCPDDLVFAHGAVVVASRPIYSGPKFPPFPPCVDDTVLKVLDTLTANQLEAVKHMTDCNKDVCGMKVLMDTRTCCEAGEGSCMEVEHSSQVAMNAETEALEVQEGEEEERTVKADKRGYKPAIAKTMNVLWPGALQAKKNSDSSVSASSDEEAKYFNKWRTAAGLTPRSGSKLRNQETPNNCKKQGKRRVRFRSKPDTVPSISARASESVIVDYKKYVEEKSRISPDEYDSLSEPESDEEIVTKSVRTDSEHDLRRRNQEVYDSAPWWDDRHRVYVSAPEVGNEHHRTVYERYDRTAEPETPCCRIRSEATFGEDAILQYLADEDLSSPGGIVEQSQALLNTLCTVAALIAIAASSYVIYERLPLPNAHALYYLYAIILCLLFHLFVFCSSDALACALLATWLRRRRIARARSGGQEGEDIFEEKEEE